jgi:putative inorganic carbon (HCO3(-)) transporter
MTKVPSITACGVGLSIGFGILTLFVTARWPVSILEAGLFVQAATLLAWAAVRDIRLHWHPVLLPVACTAVWSALQSSMGLSAAPWLTGEKSLEYVAMFAALVLIAQAASDPIWRRRTVNGLLIFGTLLAIVSLIQLFSSPGRAFWVFETGYTDLVLGPFVSPNTFAQFVEILFPLALYRAICWRRRAPLMVIVAGILFASTVAGGSRVGTIILLAEIPLVLWLSNRRGLLSGRATLLYTFAFTSAITLWSFLAGWDYLFTRFGQDPWTDLRWPVMRASFHMLEDHFWFGVGYGAWPVVYPQYATFDSGLFVNQAHCDWLQMACEGGILGLGFFVWSIATLYKGLLRSVWGVGFLGVLCHAILDFPFQHRPAFTVFLFCAAMLAAHGEAHSTRHHRTRSHSSGERLGTLRTESF